MWELWSQYMIYIYIYIFCDSTRLKLSKHDRHNVLHHAQVRPLSNIFANKWLLLVWLQQITWSLKKYISFCWNKTSDGCLRIDNGQYGRDTYTVFLFVSIQAILLHSLPKTKIKIYTDIKEIWAKTKIQFILMAINCQIFTAGLANIKTKTLV